MQLLKYKTIKLWYGDKQKNMSGSFFVRFIKKEVRDAPNKNSFLLSSFLLR